MPAVAVIPVKSFSTGKQRLADSLTGAQRGALARAMTEHVARAAEEAGLIPTLVTADPEVKEWAAASALPSIHDPGDGLNAAATAGADWARRNGSGWVILPSDLPLLTAAELGRFLETADDGDAIAPSSDGGTSAITSRGPIEFVYGPGSFNRHLPRLARPTVVAAIGLLHDLDSPADLESVRRHPRGAWVRDVIA